MALGQWILHREVQKTMGTLRTHHRTSPEQPKRLQTQHQLSNGQNLQICKNAAVQQRSELKAHNLLTETTLMDSLSPAVSTTVNIFTDLRTYLSPAVSTTVKVCTLLDCYSYTCDYITVTVSHTQKCGHKA